MEGLIIKQENGLILNPHVSKQIAEFERQAKAIKEAQDKLKADILSAMEANNIVKLDTEDLTITYVAETYRESFDSKALKADHEELYNQYTKISPVKASIRLKVK